MCAVCAARDSTGPKEFCLTADLGSALQQAWHVRLWFIAARQQIAAPPGFATKKVRGLYARGAAGRDCNHRHAHRAVAASCASGARVRPADEVPEQPPPDGACAESISEC